MEDQANLLPKAEDFPDRKKQKSFPEDILLDDAPLTEGAEDGGLSLESDAGGIVSDTGEDQGRTGGGGAVPAGAQSLADSEVTEGAPPDVSDEKTRLQNEIEGLRKENGALLDRLQRAQAEFENIRKRLAREKSDARQYAAMGTIEALLPIVDDFERALKTPGIDSQVLQGLEMIRKRLFDVFERAGLKKVEVEDVKFNPYLHHAVERASAESDEKDQTILEVFQKGYSFKDRLLRPALVKVAVKD